MESTMNQPDWTHVSEIEIIYKTKVKASERPVVTCAVEAFNLLIRIWDFNTIELQEQFKAIFLNQRNRVLGIYNVSSGGVTGTFADPRLIIGAGLKTGACGIVLAHNHPSGILTPSRPDEELTRKIAEAARYFDMRVTDHLIISPEGYYSFADEGLL